MARRAGLHLFDGGRLAVEGPLDPRCRGGIGRVGEEETGAARVGRDEEDGEKGGHAGAGILRKLAIALLLFCGTVPNLSRHRSFIGAGCH